MAWKSLRRLESLRLLMLRPALRFEWKHTGGKPVERLGGGVVVPRTLFRRKGCGTRNGEPAVRD
jgi:hypothetical protein